MSRDDWYRNRDWNEAIEAAFFAKLERARDKSQYLRIQAGILATKQPLVALRLLDEYFTFTECFDQAQGHVDRASAYLALGKTEEALEALEMALKREAAHPRLLTEAYLTLPFLIATLRIEHKYDRALSLLEQHKARRTFHSDYFRWHAAHALIAASRNRPQEAKEHAVQALQWAAKEHSGFRYHPSVGVVGNRFEDLHNELSRLAA